MKKAKSTKNAKNGLETAQIAVILGSESDLGRMRGAIDLLDDFGVGYVLRIASAHRTPELLEQIIKDFAESGGRVVIAAAGMAAHLPGVVASKTHLPVIGVPMGATLDGMDALLSIVQMPPGVPVASVGVDAAKNAALLAAQILATSDPKMEKKVKGFRAGQKKKLAARSKELAGKSAKGMKRE